MTLQRSGTHHRATRPARNAFSSSTVTEAPGFGTTQASGRSSQRGSGTPITAASSRSGCAMSVLELDRGDPLAARLDDVLGAVGDLDEAVRVDRAHVAGAEPAVVELLGPVLAVVGRRDPRTAHLDLARRLPVPGEHVARVVHDA